jgi:hypothetical protein
MILSGGAHGRGLIFLQLDKTRFLRIAPGCIPWKGVLKLRYDDTLIAPKKLSYWIEDGTTDQHT